MAISVMIMGDSGTGKSSSIEKLDPETTFIINVLDKPLPFRGANKKYTRITKENPKGNHFHSLDVNEIKRALDYINKERNDIKCVIIDDWQYILANQYMDKATEKGYGKFAELGKMGWEILRQISLARNDLVFFVTSHTDTESDGTIRCKTLGKMLKDTVCVEGMFTIVLHSMIVDGQYVFLTKNNGVHLAKSPIGMFEETYIENDLKNVFNKLDEYFNQDIEQ